MTRPFPLHTGVATVDGDRAGHARDGQVHAAAPAFADPGVEQPGEILTLGWADAGEELVLPELGWRFPEGRPEQHWRNFTVRRADPARSTLDVDFFLHGPIGRASAWAEAAAVGDEVGFAGPRLHWEPDPAARGACWSATRPGCPPCWRSSSRSRRALARSRSPRWPTRASARRWTRARTWTCGGSCASGRAAGTTTVLADAVRALRAAGRARSGVGRRRGAGDARRAPPRRRRAPGDASRNSGYWKHRATPEDVEY